METGVQGALHRQMDGAVIPRSEAYRNFGFAPNKNPWLSAQGVPDRSVSVTLAYRRAVRKYLSLDAARSRMGHAAKRNGHIVYVMDIRSWIQASTISVVRGVSEEILVDIRELRLDRGQVKEHLVIHPDFERSGEVTARCDHDLEEYPLADGHCDGRGIGPAASLTSMRTSRG